LIYYLKSNFRIFEDLPSFKLVNNFIAAKEDVF